jgi:hypothetical protein
MNSIYLIRWLSTNWLNVFTLVVNVIWKGKRNILLIKNQSLSLEFSIKKTAYSIYSDIKHQTQFLLSYNFRNIKGLDIDIDLQSLYFLLPENGDNRT